MGVEGSASAPTGGAPEQPANQPAAEQPPVGNADVAANCDAGSYASGSDLTGMNELNTLGEGQLPQGNVDIGSANLGDGPLCLGNLDEGLAKIGEGPISNDKGSPKWMDGSNLDALGRPLVESQKLETPYSSSVEYNQAAIAGLRALSETTPFKDIADKLTQLGKEYASTLPGKIILGTAAAGALSALLATNSELPMQLPAIPLDSIISNPLAKGLEVQFNVNGQLLNPSSISISFSKSW